MTENFYLYGRGTSSSFSGRVYESDFNGGTSMVDMASRIESDWRFDRSCRLQAENRNARYKCRQQLMNAYV